MTNSSFDQEIIDQILDAHGVDSKDELPQPVQNNLEEGPDGIDDPMGFLR
jgi:hypothetical protein